MLIAQVVLDIPTRALDKPYDYLASDFRGEVAIGCCVLVEFAHRMATGYVVGLSEAGEDAGVDGTSPALKPLLQVLSSPYFDESSYATAAWIAREYLAPLSEGVRLFAPPGGTPRVKKDESGEWSVVDASTKPVDDRWVAITDEGRSFVPPKNAVKQAAVLEALAAGEMRIPELASGIGTINACLKSLENRGYVRIESRRRIRGEAAELPQQKDPITLNGEQKAALELCLDAHAHHNGQVVVIDGITGSGKTEVYLQLIRRVIEQGHSAVMLVPEIALTPQTVGRFRSRFGEQVAVLHSGMGVGERYDQWDRCRSGSAHVVVGARSALFAPLKDVKLVIIDEEHDGAYKQDSSPRYHACDVAAEMMKRKGGTLVLGSATPSLETLYRVKSGAYRYAQLTTRANGLELPKAQIVDLAQEFKSGQRSMFSVALRKELEKTLDESHKAVFLYNHRGFASYVQCRECGYVAACEDCSVSLTYHAYGQHGQPELQCHHCGRSYVVPSRCPECASPYIKKVGKGTEQVEAALRQLLGDEVPIIRMDADTTRTKGAHEKLLEEFRAADSGVLLGTQMIAKGLDFPDVTLVGVINADTMLNLPDFRSAERTYQLLEQVSGRAGRDAFEGKVIIQTYWPHHPAIRAAANHDRSVFLDDELPIRKQVFYPPYSRMLNILLWSKDKRAVCQEAIDLTEQVKNVVDEKTDGSWQVLGPSPCVLEKLQGSWRWHILVKAPVQASFSRVLGPFLKTRKTNPEVNVAFDVDPLSVL